MRFKGLDLNLLVALDALLSERSVSSAADRMCLSQPAMSGALNRLRDYFQDELLVMSGRRMMLTPRAEQLIAPVRATLVQIETTVSVAPLFDVESCDRRFVIEASDYICEVLIAPVARRIAQVAPRVQLEIMPRQSSAESSLEAGGVDLIITPDYYLAPSHPSELLFEEDFLVIGCQDNDRLTASFSIDDFYDLGHIAVHFEKGRLPAFAESHLLGTPRLRRIEVSVASFTDVPRFLIGTERIALMHRRLAEVVMGHLPLKAVAPPMRLPVLREVMQHHSIRSGDHGLTWLRAMVLDVAAMKPRTLTLNGFSSD